MERLRARIAAEIRRRGPIPFSRYMEMCLYEPELGYYARIAGREQFGKMGDFYTSSDIHAVFARLLARQFEEMWRTLESPARIDLIELGPGRGLFARDLLDWSRVKYPAFFRALRYTLVESSAGLRERLPKKIASYELRITSSLRELSQPLENAIIFGNEFLDALPVEIIGEKGELRVAIEGADDRFVEIFMPATSAELDFLDRYAVHPSSGKMMLDNAEQERVEVGLRAMDYVRQMAGAVARGFVVLIDYGYTREELLAGRPANTLRCFRRHSISAGPYEAPGDQDITASVNFTSVRAAGLAAGVDAAALLTQSQFLMGIGEEDQFAGAFEGASLPQEHAKVALQLKHLVTPAGLGEVFKVLLMQRGVNAEKARQLAGMQYAAGA